MTLASINEICYAVKKVGCYNIRNNPKTMEYQFQKFEGKNTRLENRITITKSNQIGFPTKFYQDNGIKNFKYVLLFWDAGNRAIGIHFTNNEKEENTVKIIHSTKGYGGSVLARSFFRTYGIDPQKNRGRYEWEKYNLTGTGEVFVIKLKEPAKKV